MARQLRLDEPGLFHHITSRGNERRKIFRDDVDCAKFVALLSEAVALFGWKLHAWVLMINHYHFVVETPEPTLSRGMHWLLTSYSGWFNKRHRRVGHLVQGRFKSFVIDEEAYLMEVMRYVALNPVRVHLVARPEQWRWSSYGATAGFEPAPEWLTIDTVLDQIRPDRAEAQKVFRAYVDEKIGCDESIWDNLVNGIFLGRTAWLEKMRGLVEGRMRSDDHPMKQRAVGRPSIAKVVKHVARACGVEASDVREGHGGAARMLAAWLARHEGLARLRSIGATLRLRSSGYVSDLVRRCERELCCDPRLRHLADACLALVRGLNVSGSQSPYWPAIPLGDVEVRETSPAYGA
jgi:REP element-mobilizing transposase RayT